MFEEINLMGSFAYFRPDGTMDGSPQDRISQRWNRERPDPKRTRKPTGFLFPKPYAYTYQRTRNPYGTIEVDWGAQMRGVINDNIIAPIPYHDATLAQRCEVRALQKLKDQRVNLGVAMAEAQSTANLLGDVSKRLYKGYKKLADLDPKGAVRALTGRGKGAIPDRWLEYQYGINPLLQDINGAVEALQGRDRTAWITRVKASAESRIDIPVVHTTGCWGLGNLPVKGFVHDRAYASIRYIPQNYALASLAKLGLTNPLEVLWEKTPFSFVLDWFLPVGDWLNTMDAAVGWEFHSGSLTQFTRNWWHPDQWQGRSNGGYTCKSMNNAYSHAIRFTRSVYTESPLPRFPSFKSPFSLGHMANGCSLLASVFGGRR